MTGPRGEPPAIEQLMMVSRRADDRAIVVVVTGEVDILTAPRLGDGVAAALHEAGTRPVVVDLSRVELLDSAGLAALTRARQLATRTDTPLRLVVDHARPVIRPLQITGMDRWLELHHTVDEALHRR